MKILSKLFLAAALLISYQNIFAANVLNWDFQNQYIRDFDRGAFDDAFQVPLNLSIYSLTIDYDNLFHGNIKVELYTGNTISGIPDFEAFDIIGNGSNVFGNGQFTFEMAQLDSVSWIRIHGNSNNDNFYTLSVSAVPEPSTYALMLGGLGLVGLISYRNRKQTLKA